MKKDCIGNRMKEYEACYNIKLPRRVMIAMRIDGKSFHTMVKKWKCERPFDKNLMTAMQNTAVFLCSQIDGAIMGYVQSDEISIIMRNDQSVHSEPWFDNKVQKITSVSASLATSSFNHEYVSKYDKGTNFANFDSRVWVLPEYEVQNYLLWRQQDASRNSISTLAQSQFSQKELNKKNVSAMQDMLMAKGINWNDLETPMKRGACIVKKPQLSNGVMRNKWGVDFDIPIFSADKDYIQNYLTIAKEVVKPDEGILHNKYVSLWNERVPQIQLDFENDKVEFPKDNNLAFKWNHLIQQEIRMYISLCSGNTVEYSQVPLDDFELLIDRRGFTPRMINCLKTVLVDLGIGNELKGEIK